MHVAGAALGGVLHLAQQVRDKNRVARWVMVAFVVLVIGAVNDIAHIEGLVKKRMSHHTALSSSR